MMGIGIIAMRNGNREWEQGMGTGNVKRGTGNRDPGSGNGELKKLVLFVNYND